MRATVSFALAGVLLAASLLFPPVILVGFPLAGLVSALLIRRRKVGLGQAIGAAIVATVSSAMTGFIVLFGMISLQAEISPAWGAISWGLGFGIGGAMAGPLLSRLWVPAAAKSDRILHTGVIAWLAFSFSGAVAGYLGFLGFSTLHMYSLSLCGWLAYALGGLLCDIGWNRALSQIGSTAKDGDSRTSRIGGEAVVSGDDTEGQARRSMVWGFMALALLILMVANVRWPIALVNLIVAIVMQPPFAMLGIREVSHQAVLMLVILGSPALVWGVSALRTSQRVPGLISVRGWRKAVIGTGIGASFVLGGLLLLFPPLTRVFDSVYGRMLLASAQPGNWDEGNRIHQANIMMGRSALRGGNLEKARSHLLAAGRTPGSPQLNSFGPDMSLAKEMLEAGERETVLEYLALCRSFWKGDEGRLNRWSQDIKEGRNPDFELSPRNALVTDTQPDLKAQMVRIATLRDEATKKEIRIMAAVVTEPDRQGETKSHATQLKLDADFPLKDDQFRGWGQPRLPTMTDRWLKINEHMRSSAGGFNTMKFRLAGEGKENYAFVDMSYCSGTMSGPSSVFIGSLEQGESKEFVDGQNGINVMIHAESLVQIGVHWWAPGSIPVLGDPKSATEPARVVD